MLTLKLILVPSVIFLVSLASKRWGSFVAGILSGMPVIAAPITLLLAMEYGPQFAISTSRTTILGVAALSVFCFTYAWSAKTYNWQMAFSFSLGAYLLTAIAVSTIPATPVWACAISTSVLLLLRRWLPNYEAPVKSVAISKNQLAVRVAASAILVAIITNTAKELGPELSGVFVAFPIATSVLAVFTHIYSGKEQVALLLRGLMLGMFSIVIFYLSLASIPQNFSFYISFAASLAIVLGAQLAHISVIRLAKS